MNEWLIAAYHGHPVIAVFLIFLAGYAVGRIAEREKRPFWS